jgi:hypothetical protein
MIAEDGTVPCSAPIDSMSLLQSAGIRIDLLGTKEKEADSRTHSKMHRTSDMEDDMSLFSGIPAVSKSKTRVAAKSSDVSLISTSTIRQALGNHLAALEMSTSTGAFAVAMLTLIILCTCAAALSIVYPNVLAHGPRDRRQNVREARPEFRSAPVTVQDQRESIFARKPPTMNNVGPPWSSPIQHQMRSGPGAWGAALSPFASALMPTPVMTMDQVPQVFAEDPVEKPPSPPDTSVPPALCPTLVMPVCEARFGVPMYELAQLNAEGELNIVGLSGNPLLRAVVRKIGVARTLEISMPEQHSAPRATVSPTTNELAGNLQQGSRALEIRGMRGSFYGLLEMRSTGACYVVKDRQTVLTIDGDAESLQLSLKSSVGLQLASVRCSAEPFGGVDHVEIRVEPGVDTVLVLAVVLAVLLLSPYLAPADQ